MPIETWKKLWMIGHCVSLVAVLQFIACAAISTTLYPGGTIVDANSPGYSFSENYLSDLGRSVSFSKQPNGLGAAFFNYSMILLGIGVMPYFFFFPTQARDRVVSLCIAGFLGFLSAIALVVIGMTPVDMNVITHMIALMAWMALMFFASSIHGLALLTSDDNQSWLSLLSMLVAAAIVWYFINGMETAAAVWNNEPIPLQAVVAQKMVLLTTVTWFLAFTFRMVFMTDFSEFESRDVGKDAASYMNELQQKPRSEDVDWGRR